MQEDIVMHQAVFLWNFIMLIQENYYVTIAQSTDNPMRYVLDWNQVEFDFYIISKIINLGFSRPIDTISIFYQIYDELGYLALPPCLWGPAEEGLIPPTFLSFDTNLMSIKRNNNTYTHYGEMASWQMRGILVKKDE